jgi:hypothetical protein
MISAIFVDRPRLAVVIAIVITIAGLLALMRIPVAQFPDIVPPQTVVSATFPGASAAVVESSIAQPIEAQVVGVDKMIYMKSTSANDGSYNLTVSFVLGVIPTSTPTLSTTGCRLPSPSSQPKSSWRGSRSKKSRRRSSSSSCSTARTVSRTRCSSPITLSSMCSTCCH